jgi:hypothetical protein
MEEREGERGGERGVLGAVSLSVTPTRRRAARDGEGGKRERERESQIFGMKSGRERGGARAGEREREGEAL